MEASKVPPSIPPPYQNEAQTRLKSGPCVGMGVVSKGVPWNSMKV